MNNPRQTFSQVKDILKKLDQSIDAAREKRIKDEGPVTRNGVGHSENVLGRDTGEKGLNGTEGPVRAKPTTNSAGTNAASPFTRRVG